MNKNIEKEYKVLLTKEQFEKMVEIYGPLTFHKQVNTYYDTINLDIRNRKGAMRIRTTNNEHVFTLKIQKENNLLEYETIVLNDTLSSLRQKDIQELFKTYAINPPFQQLTKLTTYRAVIETEHAEICFDKSEYNGTIDYEIEYEYKKDHDGLHEFQKILSVVSIQYEKNCISKIQRALQSI